MRILILGVGVIGQVYAARLSGAGYEVTIVARGAAVDDLRDRGVVVDAGAGPKTHMLRVLDHVPADEEFHAAVLAVRADQIDEAAVALTPVRAPAVILMSNAVGKVDALADQLGADRTVFAFPGIGGTRGIDGTITYAEVPQQRTTIGHNGGIEKPFVAALQESGFAVDRSGDMRAWLATHAVFIAGVGAAILNCAGDADALGRDRRRTAQMVAAIGEGLNALASRGLQVTPAPLRLIFMRVPRVIAVPYWQRQLRGPVGTVTLAPHIRSTRDSEFPILIEAVRDLVGHDAPRLTRLLSGAGTC